MKARGLVVGFLLVAQTALAGGLEVFGGGGAPQATPTPYLAYDTVQEEGSGLPARRILNFAGSDITCVDDTTKTTCTVASSGGGGGAAWRISSRAKALDPCTSTEQARPGARNNHPILQFEDGTSTTRECACLEDVLPAEYGNGGLSIQYIWSAAGVTTGATVWEGYIERQDDDAVDLDSDSFAAAQTVTATTASIAGELSYDTITFTDGAQMDSLVGGERFRLKVCRDADNVADDMSGDAQLWHLVITETP